ncbi:MULTISPECIES: hypothetical protein [unclassified Pannonibacter]|uniref:hypothetical protein n=1 Tax=unclassified Pannonibacter TaxID=2627228 RepID=UPI001647725C|nr:MULTISPECIES: hypothetical protein [unclassified Pannonibacter]
MSANDGTTIARPPQRDSDLRGYVNEFGDEVQLEVIEDMQRFNRDPEAYFSRYQNYVDTPPAYAMGFRPGGGGGGHDNRKPITNPAEFPTVLNSPRDQDRMHQAHIDLQNYFHEERFRFRGENRELLETAGFSEDAVNDVEERYTEVFGAMEDFFHHEEHIDISMFHGNFDAHLEHARVQANAISAARVFQDLQRLQNATREHIGKHGAGNEADFARRFVNNMKQIQNAHFERQKTFNEDPHKGLENLKDTPASKKAMGRLPRELQRDVQDHFNLAAQYKRDQDKEFRDKQGNWGNPEFAISRQQVFNDRIERNQNAERLALQAAAEESRESAVRMAKERKRAETRDRWRQRNLERMFPELFGKGNGQAKGADQKKGAPDGERKPETSVPNKAVFGGVKKKGGDIKKPLGEGQSRKPDQNAETVRRKGKGEAQTPKQSTPGNKNPVNGKTPEQAKRRTPDQKRGSEPVRPIANGQRGEGQDANRPQQNDVGSRKAPPKNQGNPNSVKSGGAKTLTDNSKVRDTLAKVRAQQEKMREQAQRIAQQARQLGQNIQQRARKVVEDARKFPERVRKASQDAQNRLKLNGRQNENKPGNPTNAQGARPIRPVVKTNQPRNVGGGQNPSKERPNNAHRTQPVRKVPGAGGIRGGGGSAAPASQSVGKSNTSPPSGPRPPNGGGNVTAPKRPSGGASPSTSPRPPIKQSGGNTPAPRVPAASGNGQKPLNLPKAVAPVAAGGGGKRPIAPKTLTRPPNNISLPGSGNSGLKPIRSGGSIGPTAPAGTRPTPPAATPGGRKPVPAAPASGLKPPAPPTAGVKPPKPQSRPGTGVPKPGGSGMKIGGGSGGRGGR